MFNDIGYNQRFENVLLFSFFPFLSFRLPSSLAHPMLMSPNVSQRVLKADKPSFAVVILCFH